MPATRPSRSTKSAPVSPKRTSASTGSFRPPPAYGINSVDPASSSSSLAIQPSHGLPAAQKRKGISGQSGGRKEEAPAPAFHIRPAGDAYEQQADRIAEQITGQLQSGGNINRISEPVKPLRESSGKTEGKSVSPEVTSSIAAARGKGRPLPPKIRKPAEKALGHSLGNVCLHTGAKASALNREVGSEAFAAQKDIFIRNNLDLSKQESQALTLHEVVHTQQQSDKKTLTTPIQRVGPSSGRKPRSFQLPGTGLMKREYAPAPTPFSRPPQIGEHRRNRPPRNPYGQLPQAPPLSRESDPILPLPGMFSSAPALENPQQQNQYGSIDPSYVKPPLPPGPDIRRSVVMEPTPHEPPQPFHKGPRYMKK